MTRFEQTLLCGAGAGLASVAAIALLAKIEGRPVLGPVNASSHWLWGDDGVAMAAKDGRADLAHTAIGGATNIGAGLFWGAIFGALRNPDHNAPGQLVRDGALLGAAAGVLDYGLLPRRLSPGWELALSGRSVVLAMAAMAMGAVLGDLAARGTPSRR
ncbi:hypothetical protein [Pararhodobacter sp. SW119]|uniref:hypothetical protein n=1 Tax=Pararhodobacter sp. SW119 TaxID=2780075 RepID=UPI001ADF6E6E|nr:hypothetical protein [Pararhodobacter sp. SW119]